MTVEINWLAIILATVSTMVVGSIWYTPKVFGNKWMQLAKIKPTGKASDAAGAMAVTVLVSFITAYVLAHVTFLAHHFFQNSFLQDALSTAFYDSPTTETSPLTLHDAFEMRPKALTFLNVAHEFVTFLVMGLIIGLVH